MESRHKKKRVTVLDNVTKPIVNDIATKFSRIPHDPLSRDNRVTGGRDARIFSSQMVKPLLVL